MELEKAGGKDLISFFIKEGGGEVFELMTQRRCPDHFVSLIYSDKWIYSGFEIGQPIHYL